MQIADTARPDGIEEEDWENLKNEARAAAKLTAMVFGSNGEQVYTTEEEGLHDKNLPDRLTSVTLDSSVALKNTVNIDARSRFTVTIDFSSPPNFGGYDPTSRPTPNASSLEVTGPDETWVSGVHELVLQFFKGRETGRRLLHSSRVFFALHVLLVLPGSIWLSYRFVETLPVLIAQVHPVLTAVLYLYGFFLAFVAFRLLKLGVRRTWPYVELEGDSKGFPRLLLSTVGIGLLVALIYDLAKQLVT